MSEERITKCRTAITRKVQTARFFSLEITRDVTDDIKWATMEEREKKMGAATKLAIKDFKSVFDDVLKELRLQEVNGYYVDEIAEKKRNNPTLEDLDDVK